MTMNFMKTKKEFIKNYKQNWFWCSQACVIMGLNKCWLPFFFETFGWPSTRQFYKWHAVTKAPRHPKLQCLCCDFRVHDSQYQQRNNKNLLENSFCTKIWWFNVHNLGLILNLTTNVTEIDQTDFFSTRFFTNILKLTPPCPHLRHLQIFVIERLQQDLTSNGFHITINPWYTLF